ncbi:MULTISPECIES: SDR family NAD(P)-dependent oxidoreductase [Caproicibacterium]|uniref:SDR family NAD(P)-dependent oxidoreductase n=1 Tax=Caproicibacterium argilliputei TaxID=3030016 RepID=A0AA97D9J5_9FIRM|nr:SDR family NAD(P)-dependent oxidoreductase [Caproicibacterium argilliputei]WOC32741.1 SDR family NAD(P)-dependent oxidoreductase [Caproicibacterium argilliputei]
MLLDNKLAVVTGGTRGIGLATVRAFLAEGATVVLCGSRQESADRAVAKLKAENPAAKVEGIAPNLTDLASVEAAFAEVQKKYGTIDILVNNAGVSDSTPTAKYTAEQIDNVLDLNVKGVMYCVRAVVPMMQAAGKGVILNTSSMVSVCGQPGGIAYPASKFAVNGLTLSLARELGPCGIRVNAVAPGITDTDMMRAVPAEYMQTLIATIPLRRIGTPEDIANAFVFLASEKASYVTGTVLHVDGMART